MDQISLNRIATLHPKIRKVVLDAYTKINNQLLGKGVRLRMAPHELMQSKMNCLHKVEQNCLMLQEKDLA